MSMEQDRKEIIKQLEKGKFDFNLLAFRLFDYQRTYNPVYREFTKLMKTGNISQIEDIPFLPIQFFKSHKVKSGMEWEAERIFESSGTTGTQTSRHFVRSQKLYLENSLRIFEDVYGNIQNYNILALLPSYLERNNSSLVAMANYFMKQSGHENNGFFLHDYIQLMEALKRSRKNGDKTILLGVTFALLDLPVDDQSLFEDTIIVETGGMKGRGAEMTRVDLHRKLQSKFGVSKIHSEYGMTELLSQAWSTGEGIFQLPNTMRISLREVTDPLSSVSIGKTGIVNLIDLANVDSCAFIATDDLARMRNQEEFEVLGRVDGSDIRGCNLLYVSN